MSENLYAAVVNVSDKFRLSLNCKIFINLQAGRNSTLEDRVTHLDIALKECVRQLRKTRCL